MLICDIVGLHEDTDHFARPNWNYDLEITKREGYYLAVVHCATTNGQFKIDLEIGISSSGWLYWGFNQKLKSQNSLEQIEAATNGRTGLMAPITKAINKMVGIYIQEQKPNKVAIYGKDQKRIKLYQSWTSWTFLNYTATPVNKGNYGGVEFVRNS